MNPVDETTHKGGDDLAKATTQAAHYAEVLDHLHHLRFSKQQVINSVITPEIKGELEAIDAEFDPAINRASQTLAEEKTALQELVKEAGVPLENDRIKVSYTPPKPQITRANATKLFQWFSDNPECLQQFPQIGMFLGSSKPVARITEKKLF